jgi:pimeloyl-ACP methyl ester carboxylesterase
VYLCQTAPVVDDWPAEVAHELGIDPATVQPVRRVELPLSGGQRLSALVWGTRPPELVFLHGGGQNAHTWDLVITRLGRPAVALDLPGHGRSSWRADRDYRPWRNATAIATALDRLDVRGRPVVGMSLGGLSAIALADTRPDLVARCVLVDITPGADVRRLRADQLGTIALTRGPRTFDSVEEMIDRAVRASPRRPASAVRRGVLHNTVRRPDGTWSWRYDERDQDDEARVADAATLWDALGRLRMPVLVVKGAASAVTTAADLREASRRLPTARIETVPDAGHAVQSDQPDALSRLIEDFAPADDR